jgi:hypothetical protein
MLSTKPMMTLTILAILKQKKKKQFCLKKFCIKMALQKIQKLFPVNKQKIPNLAKNKVYLYLKYFKKEYFKKKISLMKIIN